MWLRKRHDKRKKAEAEESAADAPKESDQGAERSSPEENAVAGSAHGAAVGGILAGGSGAALGGLIGLLGGSSRDKKKDSYW